MNDDTLLSQDSSHEAQLATKQAALNQTQNQIDALSLQKSGLNNDIAGLQAKIRDIQAATVGYDKTSASMQQALDNTKKLIEQKSNVVLTILKDTNGQIEGQVTEFDKALDTQEANVNQAGDDVRAAASSASAAEELLQQKQKSYEALKLVPANGESALKAVTAIIDQAVKAETQSDYVAMYFLLAEAKRLADKITIPSLDNFTNSLRSGLDEIEKAKADAATKKADAEKLKAVHANAKQSLDDAKKSRVVDLLHSLKTLKQKNPEGSVT